jgi:hypothetical protein
MANKIFNILAGPGAVYDGNTFTTSVATIEPGLLVLKDATASTVGLAAASGSAPTGIAYGDRGLVYAPTTRLFSTGEPLVVVSGYFKAEVSSDYFTSGSVPTDTAATNVIYAGANGLLALTGTFKVGRLAEIKTTYDATGGTGTSSNHAIVEFNLVP